MKKRILIAPLSWGLGHATRCMPIIRALVAEGYQVDIAACGRAAVLLKTEFPKLKHHHLHDYHPPYPKSSFFLSSFAVNLPKLLAEILSEHARAKQLIEQQNYDLIISDNRFGVYHPKIPSLFISHQTMFSFPSGLFLAEIASAWFNRYFHRHFTKILVPDFADSHDNIAGKLSHSGSRHQVYYMGPVCDAKSQTLHGQRIDLFITISGPEPQRTKFEEIVMEQLPSLHGRIVVALGKPEMHGKTRKGNVLIYDHLDRKQQLQCLTQAEMIVCRPGYTTVMELLELKKNALFIPTPGQTEQEYLSRLYATRGWFHSVHQKKLHLLQDIKKAASFNGFPFTNSSAKNVKKLLKEVIKPVLS
ncbi:hypothetical protein HZB02_00440 [Candidatus Woesearchaeota archaeon]|nr:hypothetical protein [Candidatus Woesearchaeota archaeon]